MTGRQISVIRVAEDYPTGGRPTYGLQPNFYYLSREQVRMGMQVTVLSRRHGNQPVFEEHEGVVVHRVDSPFNINSFAMMRKLAAGRGTTVVHTHSTLGIATVALKRTLGVPILSHVHGTSRSAFMPVKITFGEFSQGYSNPRIWYYYFRERFMWSRATRVLAVSRAVKNDLAGYYRIPSGRVDVVYNGVDTSVFKPTVPLPEIPALEDLRDKRIVLYVGHFGPRKGLAHLIDAMRDVKKEIPDATLVCVGGVPSWLPKADYWSELRALVKHCDLERSVLLLDKVPNDQLPAFYSRASVFVLPSYYEAFAKVVVEAMACATPVVTTTDGGPAEVINDGQDGLLYHYGREDQLTRAIITLLEDSVLARKMGQRARAVIERNFTWTRVAQRVLSAYERSLGWTPTRADDGSGQLVEATVENQTGAEA